MKIDKMPTDRLSGTTLAGSKDFRDVHAKRLRDPFDNQNRGVAFSGFDATQVGLVNVCKVGDFLLG